MGTQQSSDLVDLDRDGSLHGHGGSFSNGGLSLSLQGHCIWSTVSLSAFASHRASTGPRCAHNDARNLLIKVSLPLVAAPTVARFTECRSPSTQI